MSAHGNGHVPRCDPARRDLLIFRWRERSEEMLGSRAVATSPWRHETENGWFRQSGFDGHALPGNLQ
jgi:hypothetical protein